MFEPITKGGECNLIEVISGKLLTSEQFGDIFVKKSEMMDLRMKTVEKTEYDKMRGQLNGQINTLKKRVQDVDIQARDSSNQITKYKDMFDMAASQDQLKHVAQRLIDFATRREFRDLENKMEKYTLTQDTAKIRNSIETRIDAIEEQMELKAAMDEFNYSINSVNQRISSKFEQASKITTCKKDKEELIASINSVKRQMEDLHYEIYKVREMAL